jgi:hypothetical protein
MSPPRCLRAAKTRPNLKKAGYRSSPNVPTLDIDQRKPATAERTGAAKSPSREAGACVVEISAPEGAAPFSSRMK